MQRAALALCCLLFAGLAWAAPPKTSIRPMPRPHLTEDAAPLAVATRPERFAIRPRPRPDGLTNALQNTQPEVPPLGAVRSMLRPLPRPKGLGRGNVVEAAAVPEPKAEAAQNPEKKPAKSRKGSVCGDPDIRGEELPAITSKTKGCGVAEPVKVTAIDGIPFSQPATIDCDTAKATKKWIEKGMIPAFGNREVVQLHIFGSYMCRTRNNVRGAKISEHGRGKAIDFAGFVFSDGTEWTVARDYNKAIRKAQKAACGIFGTTLGPGSDGYHEDHLHFDTAHYRGGPYCR